MTTMTESGTFTWRAAMAAAILINLAILNIVFETMTVRLRYETARQRETARSLALANRTLRLSAAAARRPDEIARRAGGQEVAVVRERVEEAPRPEPAPVAPVVRRERPAPAAGRDPNDDHPLLKD